MTDDRNDPRHPELRSATLSDIAARELPSADMVTVVIQHQPKDDAQAEIGRASCRERV